MAITNKQMQMNTSIRCLIVDDEHIARNILENYIDRVSTLELLGSCSSASEALQLLSDQHVDVLFLDINMPNISGITLAKSLPSNTKVIFTTAYREYAVDGFDLRAVDYLLKPISFDRFLQAINRFFELRPPAYTPMDRTASKTCIYVRSDRKKIKIDLEDIRYIESYSDYLKIYTNDEQIVTRQTMASMEEMLSDDFIRIHRSYIIALNHMKSFTNEWVEVGGKTLPISRKYRDTVLSYLEDL